jgi:hypothetical protein
MGNSSLHSLYLLLPSSPLEGIHLMHPQLHPWPIPNPCPSQKKMKFAVEVPDTFVSGTAVDIDYTLVVVVGIAAT